MKKILFAGLLSGLLCNPAFAAIKEVIKEATGSGPTQHQAISEALLIAVQSVNGASVSSQMNYEETVSLSVNNQGWTYTGKVSPVFSVANQGSGSVTKFQVLSVSGAKNNYRAKVRAHVVKFESTVQDQHMRRIAVLPFQMAEKNNRLASGASASEFSQELSDTLGTYLAQSGQLSVVDRHYIDEMQFENELVDATIHVHGDELIPDYTLSQTSSGKLSKKKMAKGAFNELYQDHVCSAVLRVARELFNYLHVTFVRVNAVAEMLNTQTGYKEKLLILSVIIPRDTLDKMNLDAIDPSDSMGNFIHAMKFKKTDGFREIARVDWPPQHTHSDK